MHTGSFPLWGFESRALPLFESSCQILINNLYLRNGLVVDNLISGKRDLFLRILSETAEIHIVGSRAPPISPSVRSLLLPKAVDVIYRFIFVHLKPFRWKSGAQSPDQPSAPASAIANIIFTLLTLLSSILDPSESTHFPDTKALVARDSRAVRKISLFQ